MKEGSKAVFNFNSYIIKKFTLNEFPSNESELSIEFDPIGSFLFDPKEFLLQLGFNATFNSEHVPSITAILEAKFKFSNVHSIEEIPEYFYNNSIAIVFPYLRAFITTLTSVAGINPPILPTLNLTNLSAQLKVSTKVIRDKDNMS
jgi:preprotein translocase subunit SecB